VPEPNVLLLGTSDTDLITARQRRELSVAESVGCRLTTCPS
jgi:hypothetical protein